MPRGRRNLEDQQVYEMVERLQDGSYESSLHEGVVLAEHPRNPRRGDEEQILASIKKNGWYGTITVQVSTGYILAGNHRFRVAASDEVKAGAVPVYWVDCSDEVATRILLADNRTADLGSYDEVELQSLMDGLRSLEGTGYLEALEAELEAPEGGDPEGDGSGDEEAPVPDDRYTPAWGVMVVCPDEEMQAFVFARLQDVLAEQLVEGGGFELRVVAV